MPEKHPPRVLTIGHSTRTIEEFVGLLQAHGATQVVDVRKMPGSNRHPQFNQESLSASLKTVGIRYQHLPGLGGLRKPLANSPNGAWRNASFRAYADYMQTPDFAAALLPVLEEAQRGVPVLMCAEAVPWRCHRSLIADALTVRGIEVRHIMSLTRSDSHVLKPWAKVEGTQVTYPLQQQMLDF